MTAKTAANANDAKAKVYLVSFFNALMSSGFWAFIWLVVFIISTALVEIFDGDVKKVEVTALSLTAAVISGHVTKLLSYALGSDSDFQNLFSGVAGRPLAERPFKRLVVSLVALIAAGVFLSQSLLEAASPSMALGSEFGVYSVKFWQVIILMYVAQFVFSWPDMVKAGMEDAK